MLAIVAVMIIVVVLIGVVVDQRDRRNNSRPNDRLGADIHRQRLQARTQRGIGYRSTGDDGTDGLGPPGRRGR